MFLERLTTIRVCLLSFVFCLLTCGGGSATSEGESEAEGEGECTAESCDDGVECTDDSRNEENCECAHMALHARCSQGQICDLDEGCVSPPPCGSVSDCPDPDDPCVVIECESSTATCTYDPLDSDGDGHAPQVCVSVGGDDCDDSPPCDPDADENCAWEDSDGGSRIYPGAEEICDEKDNDCNGEVDDLTELGLPCDGDDGDECAEGVWECWYGEGRGLGCSDNTSTNRELCNNADDDCDDRIDEDWPELGDPCDGTDGDLCEEGVWVCNGSGGVICNDTTGTISEICNGEDDDCDGVVDDVSTVESCNGEDDDCDGLVDEDWPELGTPCDGIDGDRCAEGVWVCNSSGTRVQCSDTTGTNIEICDNEIDDDCNGMTDCEDGGDCAETLQCQPCGNFLGAELAIQVQPNPYGTGLSEFLGFLFINGVFPGCIWDWRTDDFRISNDLYGWCARMVNLIPGTYQIGVAIWLWSGFTTVEVLVAGTIVGETSVVNDEAWDTPYYWYVGDVIIAADGAVSFQPAEVCEGVNPGHEGDQPCPPNPCGFCGNRECDARETCSSCPVDCGDCPVAPDAGVPDIDASVLMFDMSAPDAGVPQACPPVSGLVEDQCACAAEHYCECCPAHSACAGGSALIENTCINSDGEMFVPLIPLTCAQMIEFGTCG